MEENRYIATGKTNYKVGPHKFLPGSAQYVED